MEKKKCLFYIFVYIICDSLFLGNMVFESSVIYSGGKIDGNPKQLFFVLRATMTPANNLLWGRSDILYMFKHVCGRCLSNYFFFVLDSY